MTTVKIVFQAEIQMWGGGGVEKSPGFNLRVIIYLDDAISSGVSVLVHCLAGVSRSVTIMIAYLICSKRMQLAEAIEHVRRRRPNISPNFNFMGQLLEFEKQQHHLSSNSVS